METTILSTQRDVHARLTSMGLTEQTLREVVEAGERSSRKCTDNHPITSRGYYRYAEMIKALRDRLIPIGWSKRNDRGVEGALHPLGMALTVATGDEGTGVAGRELKLKNPKGKGTAVIVERNANQLEFNLGITTPASSFLGPLTWYLVVARRGSELFFELALPSEINEGIVQGWKERVIFAPITFDSVNIDSSSNFDDEASDIVVEVSRKF